MYRRNTLQHALTLYDRMRKDDEDKVRPLNRPREWKAEERRTEKRKKRQNWSNKGGCIAPIMVPATPGSELAKMLRGIAEKEAAEGVKFQVVETGGLTIKSEVQRSNPTATAGCQELDCLPCRIEPGMGGNCRRSGVQYQLECRQCPEEEVCVYIGETSRNLYTRGKEHMDKYRSRKRKEDSFIEKHQIAKHGGGQADFTARVTGSFRDCLSRQVSEGVHIRRSGPDILNSKSEWHQPALWRVQSEVVRS